MYIIMYTLQWNFDYPNLIYPNPCDYPNSSEAIFYYEYYYNLQDGRSLGNLVFVVASATSYLLLFSVEECFLFQFIVKLQESCIRLLSVFI